MTLIEYMVEKEQLRREWAEDLNTKQPEELYPYDEAKVWWRCGKGHEWQDKVRERVNYGTGCPVCSAQEPECGVNSLAASHPQIAAQWHPTLNGELKPSDVRTSSGKSVWWRCEKGHEWKTSVSNRTYVGTGCPTCTREARLADGKDLASVSPELAAQWHPTLNGELRPDMVVPGSARQVWWKCGKGHEWKCTVNSRAKAGTGCPYCAGLKIIPGENDLATLCPDVAAEWDYELNGDTELRTLSCYSRRKFWWRCEKGHSWQTSVAVRTVGKSKCPYCSGRKTHTRVKNEMKPKRGMVPGEKDLATLNPEIAKDWHPTRNGDSKPSDVSPKSRKQIWWRCEKARNGRRRFLHA